MKYLAKLLAAVLVSMWAHVAIAQLPVDGRVALVIGNAAYPSSPLHNTQSDAIAMADLLTQAGFKVNRQLDTSQAALRSALESFGAQVRDPKVKFAIFYYAGHGIQMEWRNYLIPVDAKVRTADDVRQQLVDVSELLHFMEKTKNKSFLIILDACREDPFGGSFHPTNKGLSQFDAPVGSLLAYATAPGNVAQDGDGKNGLYTSHLLREFSVRDAKLEDAFKRVRLNVRVASHGTQIPWESTSLEEDLYLFPGDAKKLTDAEREVLFDREVTAWKRIKTSNDTTQLANFIREFPSGSTNELAQSRLNRLLRAQLDVVAMADANTLTRDVKSKAQEEARAAQRAKAAQEAQDKAARAQEQKDMALARERAAQEEKALQIAQAKQAKLEADQAAAQQKADLVQARLDSIAQAKAQADAQKQALQAARDQKLKEQEELRVAKKLEEMRQAEEKAATAREQKELAQARERAEQEAYEHEKALELDHAKQAKLQEEQRMARQKAEMAELAEMDKAMKAHAEAAKALRQQQLETERLAARRESALKAEQERVAAAQAAEESRKAAQIAAAAGDARAKETAPRVTVAATSPQSAILAPTPYYKGFNEHARSYAVGDEYRFRVIDQLTKNETPLSMAVTRVDVDQERVEYNAGEYLSDLMGNTTRNVRGDLDTPRQFYPAELFIGKKWHTKFRQTRSNGSVYNFYYDMKVVGRERITVPAGTFDAYKLEGDGYNVELGASLQRRIWVVPGISADIAHETLVRTRTGKIDQNDRQELTYYKAANQTNVAGR